MTGETSKWASPDKSDESVNGCAAVAVALITIVLIVWAVHAEIRVDTLRREAIELGVARYAPDTGVWEWTVTPPSPGKKP